MTVQFADSSKYELISNIENSALFAECRSKILVFHVVLSTPSELQRDNSLRICSNLTGILLFNALNNYCAVILLALNAAMTVTMSVTIYI